jgi:hypothetical protein
MLTSNPTISEVLETFISVSQDVVADVEKYDSRSEPVAPEVLENVKSQASEIAELIKIGNLEKAENLVRSHYIKDLVSLSWNSTRGEARSDRYDGRLDQLLALLNPDKANIDNPFGETRLPSEP